MEEVQSLRNYQARLVQEMQNAKGAISIIKEFGAKQGFIDSHHFRQQGTRFECVVKMDSIQHNFPLTQMGAGRGSNQKQAKQVAYSEALHKLVALPQFYIYMIQSRNNYNETFSELLRKISELEKKVRSNSSSESLNASQNYQDNLYNNLLEVSKCLQVLDQFCNYYKFTMSMSHSEANTLNSADQFLCRIDLKLLDRTISHQSAGNSKKNAKSSAAEEFIGKLIRESGKFQRFAENIVKQKGDVLLTEEEINQQSKRQVIERKDTGVAPIENILEKSNMSAIDRQEDNQIPESFIEQSEILSSQMNMFAQKTPELFKGIGHPTGPVLSEESKLKGLHAVLQQGQERLGSIQKTFCQLHSFFQRQHYQVKSHLAGSYLNTLFVQRSKVDIKLQSNMLFTPQLVLQYINSVPLQDITGQVEHFSKVMVYQLNEIMGNQAHYCYQISTSQDITYRLIFIYDSDLYGLSERLGEEKHRQVGQTKGPMGMALSLFLLQVARCKKLATLELINRQTPATDYLSFQMLFERAALFLFQKEAALFQAGSLKLDNDSSLSMSLHLLANLPFDDSPHRINTLLPKNTLPPHSSPLARCFSRIAWQIYQEVADMDEVSLIEMAKAYRNDNVFKTGKQS